MSKSDFSPADPAPASPTPAADGTAVNAQSPPLLPPVESPPLVVPSKGAFGFIFVTVVIDVLGFGLLIPVGPKLVQSLLNGGTGGTEAEAATYVGALMATFYCVSFLFSPLLGVLSDRFGRRPVLLIALFGSGLDFFAQALAPTLGIFFIARVINGLSGASLTVANAYVADVTTPEKRSAAFGMIGAAFGIGFVFGPLLGAFLGNIDLRLPFYVAGTLCIINWLYGYFVLPESLPKERRAPFRLGRANPVGAFKSLTRYPVVFGLAGSLFMNHLAQFILHATWVLYTTHRYGWTLPQVGLSLFAVGITSAIVQGGLARKLIPLLGEHRSILIGFGIGVLAFIGYGASPEGWMIYAVLVAGSIGGIAVPAVQSMITKNVRPDEQGAIQGALTSLQSLAGTFGPSIGGAVFGYYIAQTRVTQVPGAAFFLSAVFAFIGLLIAVWATARAPTGAQSVAAPR